MSSLRFNGGYPIQRGRGIGGLLRTVVSFFKPVAKSIGKSAAKAVKSDTAKMIGKSLKEQAINSALNLTSDAIRGNDLNESLKNEIGSSRETLASIVDGSKKSLLKRKTSEQLPQHKKSKFAKPKKTSKNVKRKDYIW